VEAEEKQSKIEFLLAKVIETLNCVIILKAFEAFFVSGIRRSLHNLHTKMILLLLLQLLYR
jgi:hypothetical protein